MKGDPVLPERIHINLNRGLKPQTNVSNLGEREFIALFTLYSIDFLHLSRMRVTCLFAGEIERSLAVKIFFSIQFFWLFIKALIALVPVSLFGEPNIVLNLKGLGILNLVFHHTSLVCHFS